MNHVHEADRPVVPKTDRVHVRRQGERAETVEGRVAPRSTAAASDPFAHPTDTNLVQTATTSTLRPETGECCRDGNGANLLPFVWVPARIVPIIADLAKAGRPALKATARNPAPCRMRIERAQPARRAGRRRRREEGLPGKGQRFAGRIEGRALGLPAAAAAAVAGGATRLGLRIRPGCTSAAPRAASVPAASARNQPRVLASRSPLLESPVTQPDHRRRNDRTDRKKRNDRAARGGRGGAGGGGG